ncbi:calcium-activated chloride channel regulator 1-like [Pelodytes ibericus]
MGRWNILVLICLFQVFLTTECSMVKIIDGGYEDIVIAINPRTPEDAKIIKKIKDMVIEATDYLFHATKKRLYIRNAKILIPFHWSTSANYSKPTTETYEKADVIIAKPYVMYGDDPYTLQYGKCGELGTYIHFTPNFLTNDTLTDVYGPRGRVFVHEWAHLRWGVFDEYSTENPYYHSQHGKVEATRKIIYSPFFFQVSQFCEESNHNSEAPNLQNKLCDGRSTWDVIKNSSDLINRTPINVLSLPEPTFTLLQYKERVITLVLDVSGSMSADNRINRLYQAAELFLNDIIEVNSYVGIVHFHSSATIKSQLLKIIGVTQREALKAHLPKVASGGTNICAGVQYGIEVNRGLDNSPSGTELVLLSDGEDNFDTRLCASNILKSGVILHWISVGPKGSEALQDIVRDTGGSFFLSSDEVDANGLIDAFSGLSAGNGDITHQAIQLESRGLTLKKAECLNGTVFIDNTVGNETSFLVTWQTPVPSIYLQDPKGKVYEETHFKQDSESRSSRLQIPETAERGPWHYSLCNRQPSSEAIGIIVNSKAADENVPPIKVTSHMDKDTSNPPNPMVIYASVSQGFLPVVGVQVTAIIETASGKSSTVELFDNGAGADIVKDDGVYSRYFTNFTDSGRYSLKVRVESTESRGRLVLPRNRALYIPGFVENGVIHMNPSRPEINDEDLNLGAFSRTTSGGSFFVDNVPPTTGSDIYNPDKITDLEAKIQEGMILLSWTATGDDLDQGKASEYDLRMSTHPKELRDNFGNTTAVNISSLKPQTAGSSEIFVFVPEDISIKNGTVLYFALIETDKVSHKSDPSNIAQAALFIPPTPAPATTTPVPTTTLIPTTTTQAPPPGMNVTFLLLIICATLVIICLIICVTVCVLNSQKKSRKPAVRL